MKVNKILIIILFLVCIGCNIKIKIEKPDCYNDIQNYLSSENYKKAIEFLNSDNILENQKIDWYYYDYALALYKDNPMNVREALSYLIIAYKFNKNSYEINYYLGMFYLDIAEYKKAQKYFKKCSKLNPNADFIFAELESSEFWYNVINCLFINKNDTFYNDNSFFINEISNKQDNLHKLFNRDDLSLKAKLYLSECILKVNSDYITTDYYRNTFSNEYYDDLILNEYITTKLIYLCMIENDDELLKKILAKYDFNGLILMTSSLPFINEKFYKYLTFYYWKDNNGLMANNTLNIYNRYHFKRGIQKSIIDYDLTNVEKSFKNDYEFQMIKLNFE